ncbi:MAG: sodium/proton-translocating pyrophosphatase [Fimbriimonadaceae bacterium]
MNSKIPMIGTPRLRGALAVLATFLLAASALASSAEANIKLVFSQADKIYLYASLAFGVIAIVAGFVLQSGVMKASTGDEKMQEVGAAIRDGAMAYLSKQVRTMIVFIVALAIGLFVLYQGDYGTQTAAMVAVSFVLGVAASYLAGFLGMRMAVAANMRTAAAGLTSYAKALQVAFRSGAVAGMMTVGLGLIGATLIFLLAGEQAMRLLIGFGFGGSLAALFMRVGGGIYTKAADVGADLVGKVEAGIPEDDPRNPAVIADNVGDNVGDCAGMAADVFESYEVTLVAAIVLGAATAAIFDQQTWMKLILFALMARGVGIIASIIGIFLVKGSDNVDSDPLKAISRGFNLSAIAAIVLTGGLAYWMMGGMGSKIMTNQLVSAAELQYKDVQAVWAAQDAAAKKLGKQSYEIKASDIIDEPSLQSLGSTAQEREQTINNFLGAQRDQVRKPDSMSGFQQITADSGLEVANYATQVQPQMIPGDTNPPAAKTTTVGERLSGEFKVFKIEMSTTPPPSTAGETPTPETQTFHYGPSTQKDFDTLLTEAKKQNPNIKVVDSKEVMFFGNSKGQIVAAIDDPKGEVPVTKVSGPPITYSKLSVEEFEKINAARQTEPMTPSPPTQQVTFAQLQRNEVPWWGFLLCVAFGIGMAFVFERLTDYYVSLHKKPVTEVADVATAGPAPMIIQGFALGKESSVFSVFAIVAALIMPLLVFPVSTYGSYILSFYGIALVGLGLLTTTGFILAMDTFGPISDNAQGVFEMSGAGHANPEAAKGIQRLDAAGNTTKALTKGFAIATAVVAAVALFHAYVESAMLTGIGMPLDVPEIFLGLLIGGAAPYLFSAFSINAVGRAAFKLINEVRNQFRNDPGIMAGTSKPNYARCVEIVTGAAQKELLGPGILAIALPIIVAFGFSIGKQPVEVGGQLYNLTGAQALGGFLAGAILSGQLLAVMLANSGGIWDNAKKLIEDGLHGGKGTEAHKAGVVCDTVGDPFKDTAGPALNPLIKVMNLIALLLVPAIIAPRGNTELIVITAAGVAALVVAIWMSKRGSLGSEMAAATVAEAAPEIAPAPAAVPVPEPEPAPEDNENQS